MLERVSHIAVLLTCFLFASLLIKDRFLHTAGDPATLHEPEVATPMNLSGVVWKDHPATLVFVLSTHCRYCEVSLPFYRRLLEYRKDHQHIQMLAAVPQPLPAAKEYFNNNGVAFANIITVSLDDIGVKGTPSLLLVGPDGRLIKSWNGALSPDREKEVIKTLSGVGSHA